MFLSTTREIWETIQQTYSKVKDALVIFDVKTKINATKQGQLPIIEYYNLIRGLWLELDQYQAIKMICKEDTATLNRILERDQIMEFLAGLNLEFDQVHLQVLGKDNLPNLNEVFAIVRSEENRRGAMLSGSNMEGSALLSNTKEGVGGKT